jgi:hypothetical protein
MQPVLRNVQGVMVSLTGIKYKRHLVYIFWDATPCSPIEFNFACLLLLADCFHGLLFEPENGGDIFLRNVSEILLDYTAIHPRIQ